ncbi:MAG: TRAP transporter substrate-binding protein [Thermodesulfobacteriota bacterium]|nr:TRAP transporter substrate-binding protein [Thermodesulfobacteriota bacterium]
MKKRIFLLAMALFLVFIFATGKFSYAQAVKPIELKLSHFMSPMHNLHVDVLAPFAKEVEERTKGRVKVTIYPGEALGKAKDHYDMTMHGITDLALFIHGYTAGRFPLTSVIELPINVPSAKVGSRVIWELYDKYLEQEYPGIKLLTLWTHGPGHLHMTKKPVTKLEDIKGLRIRIPGPLQTALLRELGVSPLTIPIPEVYDALQRGMAEGAVVPFSVIIDFKLYELTRYHTLSNLYVMSMGFAINPKTWNGLSPDIQKIIEELCGSRMSETAGASYDKYDSLGMEAAKKVKAEILSLSSEEKKRWADQIKPLNGKWIADMEAKGLPGKKIFDDARLLLEK